MAEVLEQQPAAALGRRRIDLGDRTGLVRLRDMAEQARRVDRIGREDPAGAVEDRTPAAMLTTSTATWVSKTNRSCSRLISAINSAVDSFSKSTTLSNRVSSMNCGRKLLAEVALDAIGGAQQPA